MPRNTPAQSQPPQLYRNHVLSRSIPFLPEVILVDEMEHDTMYVFCFGTAVVCLVFGFFGPSAILPLVVSVHFLLTKKAYRRLEPTRIVTPESGDMLEITRVISNLANN
jgi:hypothetical protein